MNAMSLFSAEEIDEMFYAMMKKKGEKPFINAHTQEQIDRMDAETYSRFLAGYKVYET